MIVRDEDGLNIRVDNEYDVFELAKIPTYDENLYTRYSSYKNGKLYNQNGMLSSELYHDFIKENYNLQKNYKYQNNGNLSEIISKNIYSLMLGTTKEVFKSKEESIRYEYIDEIEPNEEDDIVRCKYFYTNNTLYKKEEKSKVLIKKTNYKYKYDTFGNLSNITVEDIENNDIKRVENITYKYDNNGNVFEVNIDNFLGVSKIHFTYDADKVTKKEIINSENNTKHITEYQYFTNSCMKKSLTLAFEDNQLTSKHVIFYNPNGLMTLQILIYFKNNTVLNFHIWGYDENTRSQDISLEGFGPGILENIIENIESYKNDLNTMIKEKQDNEATMQKRIISNFYNELAKKYILWEKHIEALEACNNSIYYNSNSENYYTKYQILLKLDKQEEAEQALLQARICSI